MHESHYAEDIYAEVDGFRGAVIRTAFHDVLQRDPTSAELASAAELDVSSEKHILRYYKNLLCSVEFISTYILALPLLVLARLLINQLVGRAPLSQAEIDPIPTAMIKGGWLPVVQMMLQQPAVRQRIFSDIQRAVQYADQSTVASDPAMIRPTKVLPAARDVQHGVRGEKGECALVVRSRQRSSKKGPALKRSALSAPTRPPQGD